MILKALKKKNDLVEVDVTNLVISIRNNDGDLEKLCFLLEFMKQVVGST